jgi:RNA polymerase sigma-70 factor (ECF subfamily)
MGLDPTWVASFVDGLTGESRAAAAADPSLPARLEAALESVRAAWPQRLVEEPVLLRHLAERVDGEAAPGEALAALALGDLALACACVQGEPRALLLLEERGFRPLDGALARMGLSSAQIDDVKQSLRQQLLVAADGPPRISQYGGRGALAGWLKVSAVRAGLKVAKAGRREVSAEDDELFALPTESTPELARLKRDYQAEFRAAFLGALAALPDRDKNLLRQHHLDGLSVDELAGLYKVHRATAARWVAAARQALLTATRAALLERVRLQPNECDSIMRLVHSQLDVTLRRLLE